MTARRLLAIDTSGTNALVALGEADGTLIAERRWRRAIATARSCWPAIDEMLAAAGVPLADLGGIVVGTGPGAFTGLRVGLATAKALAHGLGDPDRRRRHVRGAAGAAAVAGAIEAHAGRPPAAGRAFRPSRRRRRQGDAASEAARSPSCRRGRDVVAVDLPDRAPAEALIARSAAREVGLGGRAALDSAPRGSPPAATTSPASCPNT